MIYPEVPLDPGPLKFPTRSEHKKKILRIIKLQQLTMMTMVFPRVNPCFLIFLQTNNRFGELKPNCYSRISYLQIKRFPTMVPINARAIKIEINSFMFTPI